MPGSTAGEDARRYEPGAVQACGGSPAFLPARTCENPIPPGRMPRLYGRRDARRYFGAGSLAFRGRIRDTGRRDYQRD